MPTIGLTLYGNTATRPAVTMVTKWRQRFSVTVTSRGYHDNGHVLLIEETYYICISRIFHTWPVTNIIILLWGQQQHHESSFRNIPKRRRNKLAVCYRFSRHWNEQINAIELHYRVDDARTCYQSTASPNRGKQLQPAISTEQYNQLARVQRNPVGRVR